MNISPKDLCRLDAVHLALCAGAVSILGTNLVVEGSLMCRPMICAFSCLLVVILFCFGDLGIIHTTLRLARAEKLGGASVRGALILDFFGVLVHGALLCLLAGSCNDSEAFLRTYLVLAILNVLALLQKSDQFESAIESGLPQRLADDARRSRVAMKRWVKVNLLFSLVVILVMAHAMGEPGQQDLLLAITGVRSVLDAFLCRDYYGDLLLRFHRVNRE